MKDNATRAPRGKRAIVELVEHGPIFTVDDVDQRFTGEWVLLLVTRDDAQVERVQGRVLAHNRSRKRISRMALRVCEVYPEAYLFPHFAGPRLSIEEFRRRIIEHDFPEEVLRAGW